MTLGIILIAKPVGYFDAIIQARLCCRPRRRWRGCAAGSPSTSVRCRPLLDPSVLLCFGVCGCCCLLISLQSNFTGFIAIYILTTMLKSIISLEFKTF